MASRSSLQFRRSKNQILKPIIILTVIIFIGVCGLVASLLYLNHDIRSSEAAIEVISKESEALQQEVVAKQEEEAAYKKEVTVLKEALSQYKPIVIPESMKIK